MQAVHKVLLDVNEEFLVSECPSLLLVLSLQEKGVLTQLDLQQIRSLEAQGRRAVMRYVLHVLPMRGPLAFPALLESLQTAQAQHLVDLLLEQERELVQACKPIELPEDIPQPPPTNLNINAQKLRSNMALIKEAVNPDHVIPALAQYSVLTPHEIRLLRGVEGRHELTWTILEGALMQRGQKAYTAFMAALLQNGYSALFHTIEESPISSGQATTPRGTATVRQNDLPVYANKAKPENVLQDEDYILSILRNSEARSSLLRNESSANRPDILMNDDFFLTASSSPHWADFTTHRSTASNEDERLEITHKENVHVTDDFATPHAHLFTDLMSSRPHSMEKTDETVEKLPADGAIANHQQDMNNEGQDPSMLTGAEASERKENNSQSISSRNDQDENTDVKSINEHDKIKL